MSEPTFTAKNKNKEKTRKPQKIGTLPCFVSVFLWVSLSLVATYMGALLNPPAHFQSGSPWLYQAQNIHHVMQLSNFYKHSCYY